MTGYELADTAVKVLGGALTTAVASFVITRNQHIHDASQRELMRRHELLGRVADQMGEYFGAPTVAAHVLAMFTRGRATQDDVHGGH